MGSSLSLSLALSITSRAPNLSALLADLSLSYTQGGTIILGAYLGFMIATLLTGALADATSNRVVLIVAGVCCCIGIAGFSYAAAPWLLFMMIMIMGLGLGTIEVGANALIVDLHGARRGRYLNLLAVFHGTGALLVPIYSAQLLNNGVAWRGVYRYTIVLGLLMVFIFSVLRYPKRVSDAGRDELGERRGGVDWGAVRKLGFTSKMNLVLSGDRLLRDGRVGYRRLDR